MAGSLGRYLIYAILLGLFGRPDLAAQGATPPAVAPRALQLRFYAYGEGDFSALRIEAKPGDFQALPLYVSSVSSVIDYRGSSNLRLYRDVVAPDGTRVPRPVAEVEVPEGLREVFVLVLAVPGADGEPPLRLFVSDDSRTAVPQDHLAFLNLTGAALEGVVGDTPVSLGAGLSKPVSVESYFGQRAVLVGLTVRYQDSQRIVLENRTRFHAGRRTLVVLLPPAEAGSFDIIAFRIQDLVPDESAESGGR